MAKVIMVQGTMSNAGKSLLVAGLLRVFKQDGYKVAPFKSQNMALNSFVTKDGLEMGRAQVMQAEAAEIEPHVDMNPILLKPTTDMGSQVIVNGEVQGTMMAADYFKQKKYLIPNIMRAYRNLEEEYDIIVIEGAGSPAEINLKKDDIVNMGMAKMANAPVLLVGDIDRGGVFAQLYGTAALLEDEEKRRIAGVIINKFRGDKNILLPGLQMLEEKIDIPVVGVVPYINIDIDDEDSLSQSIEKTQTTDEIDIAVIKLPKLSNFTDFNALEYREGVSVRYVKKPKELKNPDLLILPGTKNTMEDLKWLRESGLEGEIIRRAAGGTLIMGICGGYQMLGKELTDPFGIEARGVMRGMGLLPIKTIFAKKKTRTRMDGIVCSIEGEFSLLSGASFQGYEIHMGETMVDNATQFSFLRDGKYEKQDGVCCGNVFGTYVHGIFDEGDFTERILRIICKKKGIDIDDMEYFDLKKYKESQYDLLADTIRRNVDMKKIYEILGVKRCQD